MSSSASSPLEIPTPTTSARWFMGVVLFFSALFWLGVVGQLLVFVPRTQQLFDEFKMTLPHLSEWVLHDSWWFIPLVVVVAVGFSIYLRKKWAWNFTLLILPLLVNLIICVSLFLPTMEFLDGLLSGVRAQTR